MSTIFIIRHGQASFGHGNYDQLSPTGYRQSRIVAARLRELGIRFDAVYTGSLARQKQTFQAMADAYADQGLALPEAIATPDLNEYDAEGVWQHFFPLLARENPEWELDEAQLVKDPRAFQRVFARIVHRWIQGQYDQPQIESWPAFRSRVQTALKDIMQREGSGKNVMAFSSAGPIAVAVQWATGMPDDRCIGLSWQVLNASLTKFRYNPKKMTLVGFNDVAALEIEREPGLLTYR